MDRLTARQHELLRARCIDGLTYAETAARFGISPHTVHNVFRVIYDKLGVVGTFGACRVLGEADPAKDTLANLTRREREIVALRCGPGELSSAEAGRALGIANSTVNNLTQLMTKRVGIRFSTIAWMFGRSGGKTIPGMRPEGV